MFNIDLWPVDIMDKDKWDLGNLETIECFLSSISVTA